MHFSRGTLQSLGAKGNQNRSLKAMQAAANLDLKSWMQCLKLEFIYTFSTPVCQPVS